MGLGIHMYIEQKVLCVREWEGKIKFMYMYGATSDSLKMFRSKFAWENFASV